MKNMILAIVIVLGISAAASAAYVIRYNPSCGKWDVIYVPDCAPAYPVYPAPCPAYRPYPYCPTYYNFYRSHDHRRDHGRRRNCH